MNTEKLFCTDCKHIKVNYWATTVVPENFTCKQSIIINPIDVVTGDRDDFLVSCKQCRAMPICGPTGILWEPSVFYRFVKFIKQIVKVKK